jgi:hypothetical protein
MLAAPGYPKDDSPKFEQAAVRWLARFALEGRDVRLMTFSSRRPH